MTVSEVTVRTPPPVGARVVVLVWNLEILPESYHASNVPVWPGMWKPAKSHRVPAKCCAAPTWFSVHDLQAAIASDTGSYRWKQGIGRDTQPPGRIPDDTFRYCLCSGQICQTSVVVFSTLPAGSPGMLMLSNRRVYDKLAPGLAGSPMVDQMAVPSAVTVALLPLLLAVVVRKSAPSMCTADGQVGHADPEHAVESTLAGGAVGMAAELAKKPSISIPQPYI
eukprot:COSAG02_NODE_4530_length_5252_cov_5.919658_6_plen_223_part_00